MIRFLNSSVSSDALFPPLDPDEVLMADLLVSRGDHPRCLYLWNIAAAVPLLACLVVAPHIDRLSTQVLVRGATCIACQQHQNSVSNLKTHLE